jgi:hypothetical protein
MPEKLVSFLERCVVNIADVTTEEMIAAITDEEHQSYIAGLDVPVEVCFQSYIRQIDDFMRKSNRQPKDALLPKYVGIFFPKTEQEVLRSMGCLFHEPHITIWHVSQNGPIGPTKIFVGKTVIVSCDALLRSSDGTRLALRVSSMCLEDGTPVPCQNEFIHITMVSPKGEAHRSNELPRMVEEGTAMLEPLYELLVLKGEVKEKK